MDRVSFEIAAAGTSDARRVAFADGGVVFIKGDTGDHAYLVASGRVEIREHGRVIEAIEPGEMFGEMALVDSEPRSASAVAVGPTELILLDRPEFERRIRDEPEFAMKVMRLMSRRLRAALAASHAGETFPMGVAPRRTASPA